MRNKRKCITIVKGLELFGELFASFVRYRNIPISWNKPDSFDHKFCFPSGIKLSDASKKLGKKFATGASVVKVCRRWIANQIWIGLLCLYILVILGFGPADLVTNGNKYDLDWAAYGFVGFVIAFRPVGSLISNTDSEENYDVFFSIYDFWPLIRTTLFYSLSSSCAEVFLIYCVSGTNWKGTNWRSRRYNLWYRWIHYRHLARRNITYPFFKPDLFLFWITSVNLFHNPYSWLLHWLFPGAWKIHFLHRRW